MHIVDRQGNPRYTNMMRDEVTTKSVVRGTTGEISNNVQSFTFSVGAHQKWKPELSEWVLRVQITDNLGAQLNLAGDISPAINCALNGWQYIHFYGGGQKLDELSEHVAEVASIRTRLEKSKSWFDSVGKVQYWDSSFALRQNILAADAPQMTDSIATITQTELTAIVGITFAVGDAVTVIDGAIAGQSNIDFANGTLDASQLRVGDRLRFNNATHGNAGVECTVVSSGVAAADQAQVSPRIAPHGATAYALGDITVLRTIETTTTLNNLNVLPVYNSRDDLEIQFKLPLGISYLDEMPPGEYEWRLRGFSFTEFSKRFIESLNADKAVGAANDFLINVVDMYYYPYIVECPVRMDDGIVTKTFKCYEAQKKKILSSNNQLQFTVRGNSSALGFGLQDGRVGSDSRYSPSRMRAFNDAGILGGGPLGQAGRMDTKLGYYQIRYANRYKPEPSQQDNLTDARSNRIVQSYIDTFKNSGSYYYEGSMETLDDFIQRGPLYYWQWPRDKNTYATEARVDLRFSAGIDPQSNVFCVFFFSYYKTIKITIKDGKIISVEKDSQ